MQIPGWAGVVSCGAALRWAAPPDEVSRALWMLVVAPRSSLDGGGLGGIALPLCGAAAWLLLGWSVAVLALVGVTRVARCQRPARWLLRLLLPGGPGRLVGGLLGLALVAAVSPAVANPAAAQGPTTGAPMVRPRRAATPPTDAPHLDLDWPTSPKPSPTAGPLAAPTPTPATQTPAPLAPVPTGVPPASAHPPKGTTSGAKPSVRVTVRRGDTLWGLAASQLRAEGTPPTERAVAVSWPRWWAANRRLIGPDPDLIRPGQRLLTP
jgi:hypothetical protein